MFLLSCTFKMPCGLGCLTEQKGLLIHLIAGTTQGYTWTWHFLIDSRTLWYDRMFGTGGVCGNSISAACMAFKFLNGTNIYIYLYISTQGKDCYIVDSCAFFECGHSSIFCKFDCLWRQLWGYPDRLCIAFWVRYTVPESFKVGNFEWQNRLQRPHHLHLFKTCYWVQGEQLVQELSIVGSSFTATNAEELGPWVGFKNTSTFKKNLICIDESICTHLLAY